MLCIWVEARYFIQKYFFLYFESRVQTESSIYYLKLCFLEPTIFNCSGFISFWGFIMII